MRLSVHHATRFDFDQPSGHSIHDVRGDIATLSDEIGRQFLLD